MYMREQVVKKDILALLTFLATGLLIYLSQTRAAPEAIFSSGEGAEVVEAVMMEEEAQEGPGDTLVKLPKIRDS
jgi:hypothetical protein